MASYIWDLDGTLLDSYPVIVAAAMHAAEEVGIRDAETDVLRAMKQGTTFAYLSGAAERSGAPFQVLREKYRTYTHAMDGQITLMDGAKETLERLRNLRNTRNTLENDTDSTLERSMQYNGRTASGAGQGISIVA